MNSNSRAKCGVISGFKFILLLARWKASEDRLPRSLLVLLTASLAVWPVVGAGQISGTATGNRAAAGSYTIMHPDEATMLKWLRAHEAMPKAPMAPKSALLAPSGSVSLLSHLDYVPAQRNQGSCGDCWCWAGHGCLEILLHIQTGIFDRLSVQEMNSCETVVIGLTCCAGGWLSDLQDFYRTAGYQRVVPWSNPGANWQDGDASCDTTCASITTTPNYPVQSITANSITTRGVGQAQAIANIKAVLNSGKPVAFAFFMATQNDWNTFDSTWYNQAESTTVDFDYACGHTFDSGYGGHEVLCVGYNDNNPNDPYWIMVNSWGTTSGRPNGIFHVKMNNNYDCTWIYNGYTYPSYYWEYLDVTYTASSLRVTPLTGLAASGTVGGPFTPNSQIYVLSNSSVSSLSWAASHTQTWVSVSATSGTLSPSATTNITVSLNANANALPVGTYSDAVIFSNLTAGVQDVRAVSLSIDAPRIYYFPLDTDPGWTREGEWAFGHPMGLGGTTHGQHDPSNGATGANVFGVNLSGDYSLTVGGPYYLTVGPLNFTGYTNTQLRFQRWLNTDYQPYVSATIEISTNGSAWSQIWSNGTSEIADSSWGSFQYNISARADNRATVYIRWSYQVGSAAFAYSGWNIDDIELLGIPVGSGTLAVVPSTGLISSGTVGGPFSPSNEVYSLANTGVASLNWAASKSQSWVSLSATGGVLPAGASTNITVSINAGANSLAAGSYFDAVTFTNTTNGVGTTNRCVSLTVNQPPPSTVNIEAANLQDGAGSLASTSSVVVLVANTGTNGFADPQPGFPLILGATWGTDNKVVGLWDLRDALSCSGNDGGALCGQTIVAYTNGIAPGQKLQLYWFPSLTLASSALGITTYGKYTDTNSPPLDGSDAWETPASGSEVVLRFYTAYWGGSNPDTAGRATLLTAAPTTTVYVTAANLQDALGGLASSNSVVVLVIDTGNNGFADPQTGFSLSAGAVWGTDDKVVGLWDMRDAVNCSGNDGGALCGETVVSYTGGIASGQKLQLYWFPSLTLASNTLGFTSYGKYTDPIGIDGSDAWKMPVAGSPLNLWFLTAYWGGSNPETAGRATLVTAGAPFAAWQQQYFGCTTCPEAAEGADPDGDGQNNLAEFLAGTVPTSSASAFRITAVACENNNLRVTWTMGRDKTNALQATAGEGNGSYSTNNFSDIFTVTNTVGSLTNYLDVGAATNFPSRFYRIRLVP